MRLNPTETMQTLLTPLYASSKFHMTNGLHYNFMSLILQTLQGYATPSTVYQEKVAALAAALKEENTQIGVPRKSEQTALLWNAVEACNTLYTHLRQIVRGYAGIPLLEQHVVATQLKAVFDQFPLNVKWKMGQRMGSLTKLMGQLQAEPVQSWLCEMGLEKVVEEMAARHREAQRALLDRNREVSKRTPAGLQKARKVTDAAYDECVEVVQALYTTQPDEELLQLIQSCNRQIDHALTEMAGRKTADCRVVADEAEALRASAEGTEDATESKEVQ